jgi:hypothetical protein
MSSGADIFGQPDRLLSAVDHLVRRPLMFTSIAIAPIVALIAGILILIVPRLLNYIVALYLIVIGLLGLFGNGGSWHLH